MAQSFKEVAHLNTDKKAFDEGWDRIFGKKEEIKDGDTPPSRMATKEELMSLKLKSICDYDELLNKEAHG